jgi:hypothetical protein
MKKSSNTIFWILALLLISIGSYWFGTAQVAAPQEKTEEQSLKQEQPTIIAPTQVDTKSEEKSDNLVYRNKAYNFVLQLPPRWKDYTVNKETLIDGRIAYNFQLKTKAGKYHSVFYVFIVPEKVWQEQQSEEGPKSEYITKKNDYVFSYSLGQDDEGYAGFPEVVPGLTYKGPYFDVNNIIIPSFSFTE